MASKQDIEILYGEKVKKSKKFSIKSTNRGKFPAIAWHPTDWADCKITRGMTQSASKGIQKYSRGDPSMAIIIRWKSHSKNANCRKVPKRWSDI